MSNAFLQLAVVGCADGSKDKNTYLFYLFPSCCILVQGKTRLQMDYATVAGY